MALVVNDIVKMEWEKSGFIVKKGGTFIFATKEYESSVYGAINVYFDANCAYCWADAEDDGYDFWTLVELKNHVKTEYDDAFPTQWDNFIPVIDYGDEDFVVGILEKLGLEDYADDIKARLADIAPYGEETVIMSAAD